MRHSNMSVNGTSTGMTKKESHTRIFKTPWGWMGLAASEQGLCAIVLPKQSRSEVDAALPSGVSSMAASTAKASAKQARSRAAAAVAQRAERQLLEYLVGRRRTLDVPVDLRGGSAFQRRVWRTIANIPYGRARSYKWVAARVSSEQYARAVGHALGANPIPIVIPCHRVVAHDASLGGFSGGLTIKRRLLELEGTLEQLKP